MSSEKISEALLARHPELVQVNEVLTAYDEGSQASFHCSICGQPLTITHMEATNGLWVTCSEGCTTFRVQRSVRQSRLGKPSAV